jgi:EpsI family protein
MNPTLLRSGATIALLAATLTTSVALEQRTAPESLAQPLETIATNVDGWVSSNDPPLEDAVLKELVPTSYLSRTYKRGSDPWNLFIAYYAKQRAGENMHSPKHCLPGAGWEVWQYGTIDIPVNGRIETINKYNIEKGGERALVLYWYQSRQRIVARELVGKVLLVRDALIDGRTGGSLVRLTLPDRPGALQDGVALASAIIPQMERCLGARSRSRNTRD